LKKGITLIELFAVTLIISILTTISVSKIDRFIVKTKVITTSYSLNSLVHSIRAKTFSTEKIHWLKYNDHKFEVFQDNGDGKFTEKDKKIKNLTLKIPEKIKVGFINKKIKKYGLKFNTDKNWWPSGSIIFSAEETFEQFRLSFPVNSQRCNFYDISNGKVVRK